MSDPADPFENFAGKLLMLAMDKAPELIKLVLEYYKPSKEYEKLAQEICTLRGVQERTSETINTLTKSQDKLSQRFQLLAELTTAQDDLPSGYGRRLQDHVHGLWCLEGLHQDLDVRVEKVLQGLNRDGEPQECRLPVPLISAGPRPVPDAVAQLPAAQSSRSEESLGGQGRRGQPQGGSPHGRGRQALARSPYARPEGQERGGTGPGDDLGQRRLRSAGRLAGGGKGASGEGGSLLP